MERFFTLLKEARQKAAADGKPFRLTHFLQVLVSLEQQAIDEQSERDAASDAVMKEYDQWVSSHVPSLFRDDARLFTKSVVDKTLLKASQVKVEGTTED